MKIYKTQNVHDAALERIRYFFNEFENVIVSFSGGKDSTIVLNLALQVAEEYNRLPLTVMFLDQEAEWNSTIDYVKKVMYDARVNPMWMQIPLKLYNSTSTTDNWLYCWSEDEKDKWIRDKDPVAWTVNSYETDRFKELFTNIIKKEFKDKKTAVLAGVRAQESPARAMGLTSDATYKHITYGKQLSKTLEHYTFYPIYDWEIKDVWLYIYKNHLDYCKHYDSLYNYGCHINDMRVSNVHHETAVQALFMIQEIDPLLWEKLNIRLSGINTAAHLKFDSIKVPKKLPQMFDSWTEYRDYLLENLIADNAIKKEFTNIFFRGDKIYTHKKIRDSYAICGVTAILANDTGAKMDNFKVNPLVMSYRRWKVGRFHERDDSNRFITDAKNEDEIKRRSN